MRPNEIEWIPRPNYERRDKSRERSESKKPKDKPEETGEIPDPNNPGQVIEWARWKNTKQPPGKERVPSCCYPWLRHGKCQWKDKNCPRPHIDKKEKDRRQKILDAQNW